MADLSLSGVSKRFGRTKAVSDLTLDVKGGEFLVLLGPTGAGKTTTLRLAAGLESPDVGHVLLAGHDVTALPPASRDVAFVFQQYSLYPHLSVYENLAFPLRAPVRRVPEPQIKERVIEIARRLRIEEKLESRATQLSGGQMQRVALGRALVREPSVYLMDEPLSSLDAQLRADLRVELKRLQRELGATILYVTHDQIEAMTLATRVGVLKEGKLIQLGTPRDVYEDPKNTYVATRLGSPPINLLARELFPNVPAPEGAKTIGARTEHVRIHKGKNGGASGRVRWIEHLGDQCRLHVTIADAAEVVSLVDADTDLTVGRDVALEMLEPLFFDAAGERVRSV